MSSGADHFGVPSDRLGGYHQCFWCVGAQRATDSRLDAIQVEAFPPALGLEGGEGQSALERSSYLWVVSPAWQGSGEGHTFDISARRRTSLPMASRSWLLVAIVVEDATNMALGGVDEARCKRVAKGSR